MIFTDYVKLPETNHCVALSQPGVQQPSWLSQWCCEMEMNKESSNPTPGGPCRKSMPDCGRWSLYINLYHICSSAGLSQSNWQTKVPRDLSRGCRDCSASFASFASFREGLGVKLAQRLWSGWYHVISIGIPCVLTSRKHIECFVLRVWTSMEGSPPTFISMNEDCLISSSLGVRRPWPTTKNDRRFPGFPCPRR